MALLTRKTTMGPISGNAAGLMSCGILISCSPANVI